MKTGARNHFPGTVTAVQPGAVNDEIEIAVAGGATIVATLASASRASLGLEAGTKAAP